MPATRTPNRALDAVTGWMLAGETDSVAFTQLPTGQAEFTSTVRAFANLTALAAMAATDPAGAGDNEHAAQASDVMEAWLGAIHTTKIIDLGYDYIELNSDAGFYGIQLLMQTIIALDTFQGHQAVPVPIQLMSDSPSERRRMWEIWCRMVAYLVELHTANAGLPNVVEALKKYS